MNQKCEYFGNLLALKLHNMLYFLFTLLSVVFTIFFPDCKNSRGLHAPRHASMICFIFERIGNSLFFSHRCSEHEALQPRQVQDQPPQVEVCFFLVRFKNVHYHVTTSCTCSTQQCGCETFSPHKPYPPVIQSSFSYAGTTHHTHLTKCNKFSSQATRK